MVNGFLRDFDGLRSHTIFCMWTGVNRMSDQRLLCLWSLLQNARCPVAIINHDALHDYELPDSPFHPAFEYLSETHKSDYLRCYLMHHYGGGYTDVKVTVTRWDSMFERLRESGLYALGYTELGPHAVAPIPDELGQTLRSNYKSLIGCCAFIFKRNTDLTRCWFEAVHQLLDKKLPDLMENPARHPRDRFNAQIVPGFYSKYPLRWTELMGHTFHPAIYQFRDYVLHDDIAPLFYNYR